MTASCPWRWGWNTSDPHRQTCPCVLVGSSVLAILLVSVLLESVEERLASEGQARPRSPPLWSTVLSTFVLFKDKRLCLLMLLPLYSGLHQGFLYGEYTKVGEKEAQGSCCAPVLYLKEPEGVLKPVVPGALEWDQVPGPPAAESVIETPISDFSSEGRTSYQPVSFPGRTKLGEGSCCQLCVTLVHSANVAFTLCCHCCLITEGVESLSHVEIPSHASFHTVYSSLETLRPASAGSST